MSFTRTSIAVLLAAGLVLTGCSTSDDPVATVGDEGSSGTTTATGAAETTTTTADTSDDPARAEDALIGTSDLPPGEWTLDRSSQPSQDVNELFDVPSCKALVQDEEAVTAKATGRASEDFVQEGDAETRLGNAVRFYPSAATVAEYGRIVKDPAFGPCFIDFLRSQMGADEGSISDLDASPFELELDDTSGVDFVGGLNIRFTIEYEGNTVQASVRTVFIGIDRAVSNLNVAVFTVPGQGLAGDVGSIDLGPTADAAAGHLRRALGEA